MKRIVGSISFLFLAPVLVVFLLIINLMTWSGEWWVQWPALGLGIAWFINLFRVIRAIAVAGGLAVLGGLLLNRRR